VYAPPTAGVITTDSVQGGSPYRLTAAGQGWRRAAVQIVFT
jgi:hypothetical protein